MSAWHFVLNHFISADTSFVLSFWFKSCQNGWKQPELTALNHCWMYLKVFLLLDIVLGSRAEIVPQFWDWLKPVDSHLDWPHTTKPTSHSWYLWKTALMDALHLGRNQQLSTPLGKWIAQCSSEGWYLHQVTNSLWEAQQSQWVHHGSILQCTCQVWFHSQGNITQPPPLHQLEKATTICNGQTITLMGSAVCKYPTQGVDPCHKLCTAEFSMQWVLKISLQGSQGELQVAITRGRVMQ